MREGKRLRKERRREEVEKKITIFFSSKSEKKLLECATLPRSTESLSPLPLEREPPLLDEISPAVERRIGGRGRWRRRHGCIAAVEKDDDGECHVDAATTIVVSSRSIRGAGCSSE